MGNNHVGLVGLEFPTPTHLYKPKTSLVETKTMRLNFKYESTILTSLTIRSRNFE